MLSAAALRKVSKEIVSLQTSPPEGIRIQVDEANLANLVGWIEGPQGTPFEGGYFKVRFNFADSDFPNTPPKCTMATKIFHPNVAPSTGEICVSTLKKDWKREYGIAHILITVKCLLIHPNPESALHEEAGKLLLEAYEDYARHARLMTDVHARHRPSEFTTVSSAPQTSSSSSSTSGSVPSTSAVPQLPTPSTRALPTTTTSVYTQPLANNENVDVVMHESMTAATGPSEMMKSPSSTSYAFGSGMINSSGVGTGGAVVAGGPGSVIPKKRPPPSSAATPLSSFGNSVPPQPNSSIFGGSATSSQAGMSAVKKGSGAVGGGAGSTTAAAQKKRGLKRL